MHGRAEEARLSRPAPGLDLPLLLGVTGASGTVYAQQLLRELLRAGVQVHLVASESALTVMREEQGIEFPSGRFDPALFLSMPVTDGQVVVHDNADIAAAPASGTFRSAGMVVCPCSMKTLGSIASGIGSSLICRAADVCLKERRPLVIVPRETPLNLIHLRNMAALAEAGAVILPAMPAFYHHPKTIEDLVSHIVLKVCDAVGLEMPSSQRWKS